VSIFVRILAADGTVGYDVTERAEALIFSNVNPGGHERCTFTLKGGWNAGFPEVRRGNIVIVEDGMGELFTGRIDEQDPQLDTAEQVSVTAYGLGVRLKDDVMREIYVDADLSKWGPMSIGRRLLVGTMQLSDPILGPDVTNAQPALNTEVQGPWQAASPARCEAWYDAKGIPIGYFYASWQRGLNTSGADANWVWATLLAGDDTLGPGGATNFDGNVDQQAAIGAGPFVVAVTPTTTRTFAMCYLAYGSVATTSTNIFDLFWKILAVYGNHGMARQGNETLSEYTGFFAHQIVADIVERVPEMVARNVEESPYIIRQLAFFDDVHHEDAIIEASKYDPVDWGVWGPSALIGPLSDPTVGYFDWTAKDTGTATWTAWRDECDDVDLHTEIGSTYDQVVVKYTDATGRERRELRTTNSSALTAANISARTETLDGGLMTQSGAQQLGDTFLALSSGTPVSRGQAVISQPILHATRGRIPPWFMRADGSNLKIPDALPDRDLFGFAASAASAVPPQADNPTATVDAASWTANATGTTVSRDTVNFDSGPASILITVGGGGLVGAGADGSVTGLFLKGVTYTLTARIKNAVAKAMRLSISGTGGLDLASVDFTGTTSFQTVTVQWTPTTSVIDGAVTIQQEAAGTTSFNIDSVAISAPAQPVADRRSVFPIKRVTVDCTGAHPTVTAELDQTHDLLSILLARLQLGAGLVTGGGG
jgi:hypothetical protein